MSSIFIPPWLGAMHKLRKQLSTFTVDELVGEARDVGVEAENTGQAFHGIPTNVYLDCIAEEIQKRIDNAYVLGKAVQNDE
jgi:hypothetical protein